MVKPGIISLKILFILLVVALFSGVVIGESNSNKAINDAIFKFSNKPSKEKVVSKTSPHQEIKKIKLNDHMLKIIPDSKKSENYQIYDKSRKILSIYEDNELKYRKVVSINSNNKKVTYPHNYTKNGDKWYDDNNNNNEVKFDYEPCTRDENCAYDYKCIDKICIHKKYKNEYNIRTHDINTIIEGMVEWAQYGKAFSDLIFGEDAWKGWRQSMDKFFQETAIGKIISGNWEESICHLDIDVNEGQTVIAEATNSIRFGMHIEAKRVGFAYSVNNTVNQSYLYKVSYYAYNNLESNNTYNLIFYTAKGQEVPYFIPDKIIRPKGSVSATQGSMLVQESQNLYTKVCFVFGKGIKDYKDHKRNIVCNIINEEDAQPTAPYKQLVTNPSTTSGGTAIEPVQNPNW